MNDNNTFKDSSVIDESEDFNSSSEDPKKGAKADSPQKFNFKHNSSNYFA